MAQEFDIEKSHHQKMDLRTPHQETKREETQKYKLSDEKEKVEGSNKSCATISTRMLKTTKHPLLQNVKESLSIEEFAKAEILLEEFSDIVSMNDHDCTKTDIVQHRKDSTDSSNATSPSLG